MVHFDDFLNILFLQKMSLMGAPNSANVVLIKIIHRKLALLKPVLSVRLDISTYSKNGYF